MGSRSCSVPNCKSNYYKGQHITIFGFPKDIDLRKKWLIKIHRDDFRPTENSGVCIKHFDEKFLIREDKFTDKEGNEIVIKRDRIKLKPEAYPTFIGETTTHLNETLPKKRKTWDDREKEQLETAISASLSSFQEECSNHTINTLENAVVYMKNVISNYKDWVYLIRENNLICFKVESNTYPFIIVSFVISDDLSFKIFRKDIPIQTSQLKNLGIQFTFIEKTYEIDRLFSMCDKHLVTYTECKHEMDFAIDWLKIKMKNSDENLAKKLNFIIEQLSLLEVNKHKYSFSNDTLYFCFKIFLSNVSTYNCLRCTKLLILPHQSTIKNIINKLYVDNNMFNIPVKYLKQRLEILSDYQKYVSLQVDEIYLDPCLSFKNNRLVGTSMTDDSIAKTAHVFLITSLFSSYKDVVAICPISTLVGEQLNNITSNIIKQLNSIGFTVLSIISDNNSINVSSFAAFQKHPTLNNAVVNPGNPSVPLFVLYDSVHILKNIRNNWINLTNLTFNFPDFNNPSVIKNANFSHLRTLFDLESSKLLKFGNKLSMKSLYPSNIERQKVSLALRIFDVNNCVALKEFGKSHHELKSWEDTCDFLLIIIKWWKIVNLKSKNMESRFRDPDLTPIQRKDQEQLIYLKQMNEWLIKWNIISRGNIYNGLSSQTFNSFSTTCLTLYELSMYILNEIKPQYLLLGKFQTDPLEKRFSMYRQFSGGCYKISIQQLIETEKKIRVKNLLVLRSSLRGPITVDLHFNDEIERISDQSTSVEFSDIISEINEDMPDDISPILLYIAGYAAHKIIRKYNCPDCSDFLVIPNSSVEYEFEDHCSFINTLNRGGLKKPSSWVVKITLICFKVFTHLISVKYEHCFLELENQLSVVVNLVMTYLLNDVILTSYPDICSHNINHITKLIVTIIARILLNNYVKNINQEVAKHSLMRDRKLRKFI